MELMVEFICELIVDGILEGYTAYRKKKDPNYDNTRLKRIIDKIIKVLIIIILVAIFLGIIFLIEKFYPEFFDIIGLE